MKKFVKLTLAVALLFIGASAANAQQFGRVDLTAIIPNMPEYQEADKNLAEYGKDLQDQLEQIPTIVISENDAPELLNKGFAFTEFAKVEGLYIGDAL